MPPTAPQAPQSEAKLAPGSPLDKPLAVTFFKDTAARVRREARITLRLLAERIETITAARKADLPWLKLARFGDLRSDRGSLRHDENVVAISGIEADYDAGMVTVDEASDLLIKQGIAAVVYTSPSHTEDAPRWRVLCPLSEEMPPARRNHQLGRLNGLFRGIFSNESWTLSQAYYFGSVNQNASHRAEIVDGIPIDQHDDLDAIWRGKPGASKTAADADLLGGRDARGDAELIRCVITGERLHVELCALSARYIGRDIPAATVEELLRGIMLSHPTSARDERWLDRFHSIPELVASALRKYRARDEKQRDPRRTETAAAAFRLLRERTAAADLLAELHRLNRQAAEPLPVEEVNSIALWAARQHVGAHNA